MADKPWKREEREVARKMGTRRTPLSGSRSGHLTSSDTLSPDYYLECKLLAKAAVVTLFDDVRTKAKREGKVPVLVIRTKGKKRRIAVVDFDFLRSLLPTEENTRGTD